MPRRPRIHFADALYHVILRGNNHQNIFHDDGDYLLWESLLAESLCRYDAQVHCYCWMTNHVHCIAQVGETPLGAIVRRTAAQYSRKLNQRLGRTGHLFERRHRAILVADDRYLAGLVRYIHSNPVRAGIVGDVDAYRWTSHAEYAGSRASTWLTTGTISRVFGETPAIARNAYLALMANDTTEDPLPHDDRSQGGPTGESVSVGATGQQASRNRIDQRSARSLDDIVGLYLEKSGLTEAQLTGPSRARAIASVRFEIAAAAMREGTASLASVARRLHRSESAISQALTLRRKAPRQGQ